MNNEKAIEILQQLKPHQLFSRREAIDKAIAALEATALNQIDIAAQPQTEFLNLGSTTLIKPLENEQLATPMQQLKEKLQYVLDNELLQSDFRDAYQNVIADIDAQMLTTEAAYIKAAGDGWIEIKSEKDLPDGYTECHIELKKTRFIYIAAYANALQQFRTISNQYYSSDQVSQYRVITKPQPPKTCTVN